MVLGMNKRASRASSISSIACRTGATGIAHIESRARSTSITDRTLYAVARIAICVLLVAGSVVEGGKGKECELGGYEMCWETLEREVYAAAEISFENDIARREMVFLNDVRGVYREVIGVREGLSVWPSGEIVVDGLMLCHPTEDFLYVSCSSDMGIGSLKVIVVEGDSVDGVEEGDGCSSRVVYPEEMLPVVGMDGEEAVIEKPEMVVYIRRGGKSSSSEERILEPSVINRAFREIVRGLKGVMIELPLWKQMHPVAEMSVQSLMREDIMSMQICGDEYVSRRDIEKYRKIVGKIKAGLIDRMCGAGSSGSEEGGSSSAESTQAGRKSISEMLVEQAMLSVFVLSIVGKERECAGVKMLSVESTAFHRVVVDMCVFSSELEMMVFEGNSMLHTVIIYESDVHWEGNMPAIEIDNPECKIVYCKKRDSDGVGSGDNSAKCGEKNSSQAFGQNKTNRGGNGSNTKTEEVYCDL